MARSSFANVTEQVTELLREGMLSGRWHNTLPGRDQLAGELGMCNKTHADAWIVASGSREVLEVAGITPGSYNLPVWGYQPEGLRRRAGDRRWCLATE